jgi:hypothetical protein
MGVLPSEGVVVDDDGAAEALPGTRERDHEPAGRFLDRVGRS